MDIESILIFNKTPSEEKYYKYFIVDLDDDYRIKPFFSLVL